MDIDILLKQYYVKVEELKNNNLKDDNDKHAKQTKTESANKKNKTKASAEDKAKSSRRIWFLSIILSTIAIISSPIIESIWAGVLGIIGLIVLSLVGAHMLTTVSDIEYDLKTGMPLSKRRIESLKQLLEENKIEITDKTIETMEEAIELNKEKYNFYKTPKIFIGVIVAILSSFVTLISTTMSIIKNYFPEDMINITTANEEISVQLETLVTIFGIGFIIIFAIAVLIGVIWIHLDSMFLKLYNFHDVFSLDLKQLVIFKEIYGVGLVEKVNTKFQEKKE